MKKDMILIKEFCVSHQLEISFVHSLEEHGLIETVVVNEMQWVPSSELPRLEQIIRLHRELNINFEGIDAINHLLERMEAMQQQIIEMKNKLNFFEKETPPK